MNITGVIVSYSKLTIGIRYQGVTHPVTGLPVKVPFVVLREATQREYLEQFDREEITLPKDRYYLVSMD